MRSGGGSVKVYVKSCTKTGPLPKTAMTAEPRSLLALSRFFFAANTADLKGAYLELSESLGGSLPAVTDWDEATFCFNRLFVGPRALIAPPYASIYLDGDASRLMGTTTLKIRQLFDMLGLSLPWQNSIPDDHVAFELDALWQLEQALRTTNSSQLADARDYLRAHLQAWVPAFVAKIQAAPDLHPALLAVSQALVEAVYTTERVDDEPVGAP